MPAANNRAARRAIGEASPPMGIGCMRVRDAVASGRRYGRACAWLLLACASASHAIDPGVRLADLHRSEWTRLQGAPANADNAVVASDGMLWLVGSGGLFRFDGMRFHAFAPMGEGGVTGSGIVDARAASGSATATANCCTCAAAR